MGNRYTFQGREYTWSTGLYYFRARWYDPITGRWLSKDPIGISGGLNLYAFCANNPVNFVDPSGLGPEEKNKRSKPIWRRITDFFVDVFDPISFLTHPNVGIKTVVDELEDVVLPDIQEKRENEKPILHEIDSYWHIRERMKNEEEERRRLAEEWDRRNPYQWRENPYRR